MYTENISRSGMLVAWRGEAARLPMPVLGQIVTVEIELPANHGFGQKCIHCQGTVTRASIRGRRNPRVALRVNYMDFRCVPRPDSRDGGSAAGGEFLDGVILPWKRNGPNSRSSCCRR